MKKSIKTSLTLFATLAITASGCGRQAYIATPSQEDQKSPGTYSIPAQVDIVLLEDDTSGFAQARAEVTAQLPGFLAGLEQAGWDYHFVKVPMSKPLPSPVQILASRHDSNWGSEWTPAYPGQPAGSQGMLNPLNFKLPSQYTAVSNGGNTNSEEPAFNRLQEALAGSGGTAAKLAGTGFLRESAMLVVVVMGVGEDTSNVTYCWNTVYGGFRKCEGFNYAVPNQQQDSGTSSGCKRNNVPVACAKNDQNFLLTPDTTDTTSRNAFKSMLSGLKPGHSERVRVFSAVSDKRITNQSCRGGNAFIGTRYIDLAASFAVDNENYFVNVCEQSISNIIGSLTGLLLNQKQSYVSRYLLIEREPEESSIRVIKYVGGNANAAVEIPKSNTNGWSYIGLSTQPVISEPVPMYFRTGYFIQLNGSAELVAEDRADVIYKVKGATDASTP